MLDALVGAAGADEIHRVVPAHRLSAHEPVMKPLELRELGDVGARVWWTTTAAGDVSCSTDRPEHEADRVDSSTAPASPARAEAVEVGAPFPTGSPGSHEDAVHRAAVWTLHIERLDPRKDTTARRRSTIAQTNVRRESHRADN
jgi:hypothetical protein